MAVCAFLAGIILGIYLQKKRGQINPRHFVYCVIKTFVNVYYFTVLLDAYAIQK